MSRPGGVVVGDKNCAKKRMPSNWYPQWPWHDGANSLEGSNIQFLEGKGNCDK